MMFLCGGKKSWKNNANTILLRYITSSSPASDSQPIVTYTHTNIIKIYLNPLSSPKTFH